ncbi:hypothetical protein AB3Y40_19605 [Yoonia sp. R2331]|uniref:hypothetical protein n=1 Tax=Yoonia sp. R2331 TaxID=3237238 RepID=UPI0034E55E0D
MALSTTPTDTRRCVGIGVRRIILSLLCMCVPGVTTAQVSAEKSLALDAEIAPDSGHVTLNWFDESRTDAGAVTVNRRVLSEVGADTWLPLAPELGTVFSFEDTTTEPGVAYEYQVLRTGRELIDVGYWAAGTDIPAVVQRGQAYVIVDETLSDPLSAHLDRFRQDLIGDGWRVTTRMVRRHDPSDPIRNLETASRLRSWLAEQYKDAPEQGHAIVLVGRVPILPSGRSNPDGHDPVPQPTDLFYADLDGDWRITATGALADNRVPSDAIEMQVGRIDFANLSDRDPDLELHLLRAYFDKNHHWRHGLHGDLREAYGQTHHLKVETNALRNVVGPGRITAGGHHDAGEEQPWLWGVDFGDWNGRRYAENYANKAIFTINFGSGKQHFGAPHNPMTALLAQPWYPVAAGWGGRPAWWLHHMALGGTIGEVHLRTVNNGQANRPYRDSMEYYPTGSYLWRNPVWVNLLGDPTTRAIPLLPPRGVVLLQEEDQAVLRWGASPDPDTTGYRVFRSPTMDGAFTEISPPDGISGTEFIDDQPLEGAIYMVRAFGKKTVHAGSFFTLSQGAFADEETVSVLERGIVVKVPSGGSVSLPAKFSAPEGQTIRAVVAGPGTGTLTFQDGDWRYAAPIGFSGDVLLRYTIWNGMKTQVGALTIIVE